MLKKSIIHMQLVFLLLLWIDLVDSIFFGNSCGGGCQQARSVCPPPPVCAPIRTPVIPPVQYQAQCPPCDCRGGGIGVLPINGGSINPTLIQTGIPQIGGNYASPQVIPGPQIAGGSYATPQVIPNGPQLLPGPQLIPGPGAGSYRSGSNIEIGSQSSNYIDNPSRGDKLPSFFTTSRPHGKHSSRNSLEDVYDEVIPTSGQQAADVSVDSKKLVPYDVYLKRNRFLKQLRNRALRQFSAKSLTEIMPQMDEKHDQKQSNNVCNNDKLAKVMQSSMVDDITMSKKLIRKAAELAFDGKRFDVLCAVGDFSYSVYAKQYCEHSRGNVTCFAFI